MRSAKDVHNTEVFSFLSAAASKYKSKNLEKLASKQKLDLIISLYNFEDIKAGCETTSLYFLS